MPVSTWVEVDLDRFASNLRAVRELLARERAKAAPDAGGPAQAAEGVLALAAALPGLRLASVYTHFPDADAEDLSFARDQVQRFRPLLARRAARGLRPPRAHAANSAGTLNLAEGHLDAVRVGLIAYGHRPPHSAPEPAVQAVMSFKSRLVQVRDLPAGATVSYGRTYAAPRAIRMGVVAVGYGHGYSWLLSNRGHMLVGGRRVPILGRVTMDLTMVDLAEAPDAADYGDQGSHTLLHVAEAAGGLKLKHLESLGLGNLLELPGVRAVAGPRGARGRMAERSKGKDSTSGHWEMAGIVLERAFPLYPNGFPAP